MDLLLESNKLASHLANSLLENLTESPENKLRIIAIYSGKFQPFHAGNYKIYKQLVKQFGAENVFIATSDQLNPQTGGALSYADKKYIINNMFPIGDNKVYKVEDPFFPKEILGHFDKNSTAFVIVLSDKDVPLISNNDYFRLFVKGLPIKPLSQEGYYLPVPDKFIKIGNKKLSMSNIESIFASPKVKDDTKKSLFKKLFGQSNDKALAMVSKKTNVGGKIDNDIEKTKASSDTTYDTKKPEKSKDFEPSKHKDSSESHPAFKNVNMDTKIVNPETNNKIKLGSALKYPRDKSVYKKAVKIMQSAGKDRPERTTEPIVNKAWTDRSVKRGGYADNDTDKAKKSKSTNESIEESAIKLAEEFSRKMSE